MGELKELLIARFQHKDSWASVIRLRRRKWPNKGMDLGTRLQECNLVVFSQTEGKAEKGKACPSHMLKWAVSVQGAHPSVGEQREAGKFWVLAGQAV